jgi:predicted ester cyclase
MSSEQQKAIVRRFFDEVWNQQKLEVIADIFASTIILNGHPIDRTVLAQIIASRRAAFPDIQVTVEDQLADGDQVATRRTWRGTQQGTYRGIAPTGKHVTWMQIGMVRFVEGRIVEDWVIADEVSLLEQLGALPTRG